MSWGASFRGLNLGGVGLRFGRGRGIRRVVRARRRAGAKRIRSCLPTIDVSTSRLGAGSTIVGTSSSVITADDIQKLAGAKPAGHPQSAGRHPTPARQRRRQRCPRYGRPARVRRQRAVQRPGAGQRPALQRLRPAGLRLLLDSDQRHPAHRDHPRQQRRGALWRRRHRRRHQHHHQERREAAAVGCGSKPASARSATGKGGCRRAARRGRGRRPSTPSASARDGYRENGQLRQKGLNGDIRYTTDEGSVYFNVIADDQKLGLPGGRLVDRVRRHQPAHHRPHRRGDAQRFRQQAGAELHARLHTHAGAGHRIDRRRQPAPQAAAGRTVLRGLAL